MLWLLAVAVVLNLAWVTSWLLDSEDEDEDLTDVE